MSCVVCGLVELTLQCRGCGVRIHLTCLYPPMDSNTEVIECLRCETYRPDLCPSTPQFQAEVPIVSETSTISSVIAARRQWVTSTQSERPRRERKVVEPRPVPREGLCWDCKFGKFAKPPFTRAKCRLVLKHDAPDWWTC
jgi:hypothetical protein